MLKIDYQKVEKWNLDTLLQDIDLIDFQLEFGSQYWEKYFEIFQEYSNAGEKANINIAEIISQPHNWKEYNLSNEQKNIFEWILCLHKDKQPNEKNYSIDLNTVELQRFLNIYQGDVKWLCIFIGKNKINIEDITWENEVEQRKNLWEIIQKFLLQFEKNHNIKKLLHIISQDNTQLIDNIHQEIYAIHPNISHENYLELSEAIMLMIGYIKWDVLDEIQNPSSIIHWFNSRVNNILIMDVA